MVDRTQEAAEVLMLLDAPGIGPRRGRDVLVDVGCAGAALDSLRSRGGRTGAFLREASIEPYLNAVKKTYDLGGDVVLWHDDAFPSNLRTWSGAPPILFFKGDLSHLSECSLALVGQVEPTARGVAAADRFARLCVKNNITVVSGLARGIDAASHLGALDAGGATVAVLGHGLDHEYPRENSDLYDRIPSNGALITQFATGVGPQRWTFPMRNELMCTLARGTVIVEGREGCGSLIQAGFSSKHHRPVFLLSKNLEGELDWASSLVSDGAHVVTQFGQVLEATSSQPQAMAEAEHTVAKQIQGDLFEVPQGMIGSESTILFDLDGVVIDSRGVTAAALASIASSETGRTVTDGEAERHVTKSPPKALAALGVQDSYNVYKRRYDSELAKAGHELVTFGAVVDGIRDLKAKGVRLAAVTSQPRRRLNTMVPQTVLDLFEHTIAWNDCKAAKPDPEGILLALRKLSVNAELAAYVGDTCSDVEAARRAGIQAVAVVWGFTNEADLRSAGPDLVLRDQGSIADLADTLF